MNPEDIARLIAEDENAEYSTCPECGDKYAALSDDSIACRNADCRHYNKDYARALDIAESTTVKITDVDWNLLDLDWIKIQHLIDRGVMGENYRVVSVPARVGEFYFVEDDALIEEGGDTDVLIWWRGSNGVSDRSLRKRFIEWVKSW